MSEYSETKSKVGDALKTVLDEAQKAVCKTNYPSDATIIVDGDVTVCSMYPPKKKRKVRKEESEKKEEHLDELKRSTLTSYRDRASAEINKARSDFHKATNGKGDTAWDVEKTLGKKRTNKIQNRSFGVEKVRSRLNRSYRAEKTEHLDELSKGMLASYARKSVDHESDKLPKVGLVGTETKLRNYARKKKNRGAGLTRAVDKMTGRAKVSATEEVECASHPEGFRTKYPEKDKKKKKSPVTDSVKAAKGYGKEWGDNVKEGNLDELKKSTLEGFEVKYARHGRSFKKMFENENEFESWYSRNKDKVSIKDSGDV